LAVFPEAGYNGGQAFIPAYQSAGGEIISEAVLKQLASVRRATHPFTAASAVEQGNHLCAKFRHQADFQILVLENIDLEAMFAPDKNVVGQGGFNGSKNI
jgi:hypothetical protein